MLRSRIYITIFILFLSKGLTLAQRPGSVTDSLKMLVSASIKDSNLVGNYLRLSDHLFVESIEESKVYANKAHSISKQINYPKGKAESLFRISLIDIRQGKLHIALNHLKHSLAIFRKHHDIEGLAKAHTEIGILYSSLGDMVKAIDNQQIAIKYYSQLSDEIGIAGCYSDLGKTHYLQKNYGTALRYYKKAKNIYRRDSLEKPIAELYNRISLVFREQDQLDKSLEYDYLALMTQEKLRDKLGIANSNYNIGKTSILQGEINRAKGFIEYAEKLYTDLGDNLGLAKCLLLIAKINIVEKKYLVANNSLIKSIDIAKEGGALKELSDAYLLLSEISVNIGDYESAYAYLSLHTGLRDTLFSNEKSRQFSEMEVKYQTQSKDEQLDLAHQQEETNDMRFIIYVSLSGVIFGLMVYIMLFMRKKNKTIRNAHAKMESSTEMIRLRNKEIIDSISYAKRIQEAILTPQAYLKNIFKDHFVYYKPKDIVSGDFYWAYKDTASNKVFWVTADCTGHGVPGALMSVVGTVILNEIVVVRRQHEADKILNALSKYLKKYLNKNKNDISQDGIELSLCIMDQDNKTLQFSGANRSLIIIRNNELMELKGDKRPIGFDPFNRETKMFTSKTINYQKEDCLYAFTDGYTDQMGGENHQKYRVGVLKQNLLDIHQQPMNEQRVVIKENLKNWMSDNQQLDDILVIGIRM